MGISCKMRVSRFMKMKREDTYVSTYENLNAHDETIQTRTFLLDETTLRVLAAELELN